MTEDETRDLAAYVSLDSLRAEHVRLLKLLRDANSRPSARLLDDAGTLIKQGRIVGLYIDTDSDRGAAQSLLDYWASVLYRAGKEPPDAAILAFNPDLAPDLPDEPCPYRGLEAFQEEQHEWFFGRQALLTELGEELSSHGFVTVVGASGSGKSSLVLGGLLPALKAGQLDVLPGSNTWRYCVPIVPGAQPLLSMARAAASVLTANPDNGKGIMDAAPFRQSANHLRDILTPAGEIRPVCLIVDQFEELFTLRKNDVDREAFVANLVALTQQDGPLTHRVIITLRSDFEDRLATMAALQALSRLSQVRVTAMGAAELREAIEAPARKVGLKFEDGVVEALLEDILGEPAGLPLLQFALLQLWRSRSRNRITWPAYKRLGNARQALARTADRLFQNSLPQDQQTTRHIFMRLVRPDIGAEVTSSRVAREVLWTLEAPDRVQHVLTRFAGAGLIRITRGSQADRGDDACEVAHEALIRNWPELEGWLEQDRASMRQRYRLSDAAQQWHESGRSADLLLRGRALVEAGRHSHLSEAEDEYISASNEARDREVAEKAAQQLRERESAEQLRLAEEQRILADREAKAIVRRTRLARISFVIFGVIMSVVASLAINAAFTRCEENCEVYNTTFGPLFATPTPLPTQTPYIIFVTATPTPDSKACTVVNQGLVCRSLP